MKISELSGINLEDLYWRLLFGRSKYRANFFTLRASGFKDLPPPVFFLSTGRCGTNWFADLLAHDRSLKVFHEPKPNFGVQGKVAWAIYTQKDFNPGTQEERLLHEVFLTGREQYLRYSYKTQRRFVETNNQVTFLAPAIHQLFPDARFVHLNRHPGEFVRSAMRRNFYNNPDDIKRIVPVEGEYHGQWDRLSLLEKNSWLWMATNAFIERFKAGVPKGNVFYFDFNRLDEASIGELCTFLGVRLGTGTVRKMLGKRVNVQTTGELKGFADWPEEDRTALRKIAGQMASAYGYTL